MTKEITLTQGKVALVDDEDFEWLNNLKWRFDIYAVREENRTPVYMHRLIMQTPEGMQTDHINGDKLNNRRDNLRICTASQNKFNESLRSTNKSGFKGVSYITNKRNRNKRWVAALTHNYKRIIVGYFYTSEEAAEAYDARVKEMFGDFAKTNKEMHLETSN